MIGGSTEASSASAANQPAAGTPPRFSRKAIWGAVWAPMFFLVGVMMFWTTQSRTSGPPEGESSLAVTRADGVGDEGKARTQPVPEPPRVALRPVVVQEEGITLWQRALLIVLGAIGFGAPIGTTVLGLVAIKDIRHSMGRIVGLPLALADALYFPILALDAAIILGPSALIWNFFGGPDSGGTGIRLTLIAVVLVCCLVALVVDVLIIWSSWRAVKRPVTA